MIHAQFILPVLFSFLSLLSITFSSSDGPSAVVGGCSLSDMCGGVNISYPFWRSDGPQSFSAYCGYPGFNITCEEEDMQPILQIGSGHYYKVTHIDYNSRIIKLTDTDVLTGPDDSSSGCPRVRRNVTFTGDVAYSLSYAGEDANLTFFFNCSVDGLLPDLPQEHNIPCLGYEGKKSFVFPGDEVPPEIWMSACEDVVVAPLLLHFLSDVFSGPTPDFSDALNYGFRLAWTLGSPEGCEECEGSRGGRCCFNQTTGSGRSFCSNGTLDGYCPGTSSCLPACLLCFFLSLRCLVSIFFLEPGRSVPNPHSSNT